jgi:hypothetical protein
MNTDTTQSPLSVTRMPGQQKHLTAPLWHSRAIWVAQKANVRPMRYASDDLEVKPRAWYASSMCHAYLMCTVDQDSSHICSFILRRRSL